MRGSSFRASNTQQGLTENMQILTGQKGDRLDKALTLREAAELGMVNLRRNGSGQIVPEIPPGNAGDPEWSGVQQPVAPTGVTADGAFHTITLTWDTPAYKGHSYAELLRAEVDNPSSAVAIGTTLANVYSDAVGKGFSAFYWVRFVNKNGMTGPLHGTSGLHAATSPDVDEIIASATNFAIYNPAKPNEKEIVFGVTDDGKVAIREAVIKAATIQIIHSEKITADYIKAGVSISAPLINGGQIDMGNAFMAGGAAGFGKGGPYGGWGWGWHTIIYSDGSIYTNRLNAEGGYVRNMTIGNCTIQENCTVLGTVYADRIVGGIVAAVARESARYSYYFSQEGDRLSVASFFVDTSGGKQSDLVIMQMPRVMQSNSTEPSGWFEYKIGEGLWTRISGVQQSVVIPLPVNFSGQVRIVFNTNPNPVVGGGYITLPYNGDQSVASQFYVNAMLVFRNGAIS